MTLVEAFAKIEALGQSFFETKDVAALLRVENSNANKIVSRLARGGLILPIARGKWALRTRLNNLAIAEHLTSPYPAYISLQSALYHHGMISQIPAVTYAVSIARTRRYKTPVGTFSIHHVVPDFFCGFNDSGTAKIATPEKALVDVFYLGPTRTRFFVKLPELEYPQGFSWKKAFAMAAKIKGRARRTFVEKALTLALTSLRNSAKPRKRAR